MFYTLKFHLDVDSHNIMFLPSIRYHTTWCCREIYGRIFEVFVHNFNVIVNSFAAEALSGFQNQFFVNQTKTIEGQSASGLWMALYTH